MQRWRGLTALVRDAVVHGSQAVERIQLETAGRPLAVLEQVPGLAVPARVVHLGYDVAVTGTHGMIRLVARVAGTTIDRVLVEVGRRG
jgi:hypothetical protein